MTCRMQRNAHPIEPDRFAVGKRLDRSVLTETRLEKLPARLSRQVALRARMRVVGVSMRNNGAVDGSPGVYVEVAGRTVEAIFRDPKHRVQFTAGRAPTNQARLKAGSPVGLPAQ